MMPARTETEIQRSIYTYLRARGLMWWRCNPVGGNGRTIAENIGLPDLMVLHRGILFGFEVKTAAGKQSPEQLAWMERMLHHGGHYHVVRSIQDVSAVLDGAAQ